MKKIMVIILFASAYGHKGLSQDKIRSDSSKWTSSPYRPFDTAKSSAKKPGHEISTSQRYDPFDPPRVSGKKPHEVGSSTPYHPFDTAHTSSGKPRHTIDSSHRNPNRMPRGKVKGENHGTNALLVRRDVVTL